MRPRLLTPRNLILILLAGTIFTGLSVWIARGMPLPGSDIPSTAGKLAFVSDRAGNPDIWMMNGDGSNPQPITQGTVREDEPSWAASGKELAFIGAKSQTESPQVYIADATTGRNAVAVTRTSGAKSQPHWEGSQEINFLDTGKLTTYSTSAQESDAIFPEADHKRAIAALFPRGGLQRAYQLAAHTYLLIMNVEDGQLLLLYQFDHDHPNDVALAMVGEGEKIQVAPVQSGGFATAFQNGVPLQQPRMIMDAQAVKALSAQGGAEENAPPPLINATIHKGLNILAIFDANAKAQNGVRLPFVITDMQAAEEAGKIVLASQGTDKNPSLTGIQVVSLATGGQPSITQVTSLVASHLSVSPDGAQVAFQSGDDIYVVPTGGGDPKNLTQGKGKNSAPVWSPLLPEAKK